MNRRIARPFLSVACLLIACSHRQSNEQTPKPQSSAGGIVITADDIQRSPGMSLEQLLLAHVPGLTMTRAADGHMILHLRGTTTFLGDEEPLFVVNGIPLGPTAAGSNLNAINPQEIERIEVLRDAAATAAYGIRGANGVILITTKQG
ncbi:MAG TPA: TonB-dependent receptor plug domain-containing protein [Gemmatimonadales bacterium]|nr:TonB-dependent receptor plug domain-containing protein [Gemmatimonadales bacterium]